MPIPTEFDSVTPSFYPYGRVALALSHAAIDAQTHLNVPSFAAFAPADNADTDYVQKIIDASNQWQSLKDHPYPKSLADGTAELNGFRHYLIQDAIYLEYYYRVRMQSVSKTGTFDEISDFAKKIFGSLANVTNMRDDCTTKLGVPPGVVKAEGQSVPIKNSIELYESVVKDGNWLDLHIVLLPCIVGYYTIADSLLRSPATVRDTVYYPLWVVSNSYEGSATKYRNFINNAIKTLGNWDQRKDWWIQKFNDACNHEKAIFELGQRGFSFYNVVASDRVSLVRGGTYTIRSYRTNAYLTPTANNTVTLKNVTADGKWEIFNAADGKGFTIKSTKNNLFLSVNINQGLSPFRAAVGGAQKHWAVNTINTPGAKAYQLLVPEGLQFVLDGRNGAAGDPEVAATNNAQSSDQIWVIEST